MALVEPMKSAMRQHVRRAFGMRGHQGMGCSARAAASLRAAKRRVHDAGALPDLHVLAAGLLLHVIAQIDIGQEQDRLLRAESSSRS